MTKADVVVCFYKKQDIWPQVAHGLAVNADHIGTVWVCNDERWDHKVLKDMELAVNGRFHARYLWHEHEGFGHHKSLNQGAKHVTTPYFVHQDDDIVMTPGCVRKLLEDASPTTLLGGICHDTAKALPLQVLRDGPIKVLKQDPRAWALPPKEERFLAVRDCLLCCNTQTYWDLGGHDEGYKGYGFIDYDWGIRWMMAHGLDSFEMGRGVAWNMTNLEPGQMWTPDNRARFEAKEKEWLAWLAKEEECAVR